MNLVTNQSITSLEKERPMLSLCRKESTKLGEAPTVEKNTNEIRDNLCS